jgi:hypothetical protein
VPGGGITGIVGAVGADGAARMPGSTPLGGAITPEAALPPARAVCPMDGAPRDGAIFSGGVGAVGGGGPGGASVLDGGLDGCAKATPVVTARANKTTSTRFVRRSVARVLIAVQQGATPVVRGTPANVSALSAPASPPASRRRAR